MSAYVKLFGSLLDSSIMDEPVVTRWIWTVMLAMKDRDGVVSASVGGLARRAGVKREEVEEALRVFQSPDPDSRTKDDDGRRIRVVDGGWLIINHQKYRDLESEADRKAKDAERKRRDREAGRVQTDSDTSGQGRTNADASENVRAVHPSDSDQISDPTSLSPMRSGSDPAGARSNADAMPDEVKRQAALYSLQPGPVTGYALTKLFGAIRSRDVGGFEWQGVSVQGGRDSTMADLLNADPAARADVAPTMALLFRRAREGRAGPRSREILTEPSLAFAAWVSSWISLREELHGNAPAPSRPPRQSSPPLPKLVAEPRPKPPYGAPATTDQDHGAVAR